MDGDTGRRDPVGMSESAHEPIVKRLERSRSDRMVAGVCGGLARYFDIHPAFYRVGFVVLTLLGGAGILIYAAAALVIPDEGREDSIAGEVLRNRRDRPWPLIGLALVGLALVVLVSRATFWPHGDFGWVLVLVAGGAILWAYRRDEHAPAETAQASRRPRRLLRALAVAVVLLVAAVVAAVVAAFAVLDVSLADGVGDRAYRVSSAEELHKTYRLGIGDLNLDLRQVDDLPAGRTLVRARLGIGNLDVIVPSDVKVRYRAKADFGDVNVFGDDFDGRDAHASGVDGRGAHVLVLDAHAGAGQITVVRAVR
jgi:phage shock protein PspC (stress-responsive transcriptional regulator)